MYNRNEDSSNQPEGHSLGGNAPPAASPDEMRQRRLAALDRMSTTSSSNNRSVENKNASYHHHEQDQEEEDADLQAALALSLQQEEPMMEAATNDDNGGYQTHEERDSLLDISSFHSIMWDHVMTTDSDKMRWVGQGINTRQQQQQEQTSSIMENAPFQIVGSNHGPWGLIQTHGGPCGVLAAVQAEMLRLVLFGWNPSNDGLVHPTELETPSDDMGEKKPPSTRNSSMSNELITKSLAMAIAIILARAALTPPADDTQQQDGENDRACRVQIVLPRIESEQGLTWDDLEPWSSLSDTPASNNLHITTVNIQQDSSKREQNSQNHVIRLALAVSNFLLKSSQKYESSALDCFRRPGGVLLLVMSLVASRGTEVIQKDMDDPSGTRLTSQFGHCSQELMNLLLTGQAVSNVFDNTLTPSGALTCRGIQQRPAVGYLSQLESLRYCEVGGYYKSPIFPIWVVGSTSHFTVLFGDANCLAESKSDVLLETCRRAFKAVEGGDENGFIAATSLGRVLEDLDLKVEPNAVQTLAATLEVSGAGIILWDDFWKASSRLMTGASIESVLQGDSSNNSSDGSMPPLVISTSSQHGGEAAAAAAAPEPQQQVSQHSTKSLVESDEELARKLHAEWNSPLSAIQQGNDAATVSSMDAVGRPASPMDMDATPSGVMTDEEYARLLQAEYEPKKSRQEGDSNDDSAVVVVDEVKQIATTESEAAVAVSSPTNTPPSTPQPQEMDFEQFGNSFQLYHYNGLRGGTLTPFSVTRLSADEAVGHSIALRQTGGGASGQPAGGAGGGDLEDVVRTKWPSCTINWMGSTPPYID